MCNGATLLPPCGNIRELQLLKQDDHEQKFARIFLIHNRLEHSARREIKGFVNFVRL